MDQGLILSLKQQLRLSQSQIQKLEMLALSSQELSELIRAEEEKNPFLNVEASPYSFDSTHSSIDNAGASYSSSDDDDEHSGWMERAISSETTLFDHLEEQIELTDADEETKEDAVTLASSLDAKGYLPMRASEILKTNNEEKAERARKLLFFLDPTGCGAYDTSECLRIQLEELRIDEEDKANLSYIAGNLEMIKNGRTDQIEKRLKIDREEADLLIEVLKTLTPFPGEKYNVNYETYIVPEITIRKNSAGELTVTDHGDSLPNVTLEPEYVELSEELEKEKSDKEALKFLRENRQKAEDIIDAIALRKSTIHRLAEYLIVKQHDFFMEGPTALKPDTQANVAEELSLSISTISRVCTQKYVETDWGLHPFSYFFSSASGFDKTDSKAISKNAVKERIREIIAENDTGKPLSDQKISDRLAAEGIKAARRTVAKYRAELDIDTSYDRKK